ncbi:MAG: phytoene desaturase family protein [Ilumatobacter sp.]|uniref:phytoene desaturase family protein n=1 Tax=Ilumatobacter sp. TaxID=1967498 RepID=UPI0032970DC7
MSRHVVVVGSGVGGLACAIRLRVAGHRVTVLERNDVVGGKLALFERDGFSFDVGPSLLTLPHVLDEVFGLAGTSLAEQIDLVRLDPQFRYSWRDGSTLDVHDDPVATASAFDAFTPGAGRQWRDFDDRGRVVWDVSERTFFAGPMSGPLSLLRRMDSPADLLKIDALRTLRRAARDSFDDDRLRQWVGRYATYSGSSPAKAPATLACIPHIESRFGCWYPMGGLRALRDAFERVALHIGVEIRTSCEVTSILSTPDRVTGVQLADGTYIDASIVVANADARHLYDDLLPDEDALAKVRRAPRSTSGFVLCIGARGKTPDILHHNVWFSGDSFQEFRAIDAGQLAMDPTIYGCVSSTTDPSQAPEGDENWFLLVNTPPGVEVDREAYRDTVLERLADHGVDLRRRMKFCAVMTPGDIEHNYRAPGGAIYGSSSNGRLTAFLRPKNRGTKDGLYLVGGSSHPGGGLPLVTTSARIVADMVASDLR